MQLSYKNRYLLCAIPVFYKGTIFVNQITTDDPKTLGWFMLFKKKKKGNLGVEMLPIRMDLLDTFGP